MMISALHATHALMLVFAVAAALSAVREGLGLPVKRWSLLLTPLLAAVSALVLISHPSLADLRRPGMWLFALVAVLVGIARGALLRLQVDNAWRLVRLRRAQDGLFATLLFLLLAIGEIALRIAGPAGVAYHPTVELGMLLIVSFLVGRAAAAWQRALHMPHVDLRRSVQRNGTNS